MKIIYDSALRDMLINEDAKVIETVLPSLAAYQAILLIKGILDTKEAERKKELEKLQRDGGSKLGAKVDPPAVELAATSAPEMTKQPSIISPMKKATQQSSLDMRSDLEKEREAEREEIKKYGVKSVSNLSLFVL